MDMQSLMFLLVVVIVLALLWVLNRSNVKLAELVPFPLVLEMVKAATNTALDLAEARAKSTPDPADDAIVKAIREEVARQFELRAQG